MERTEYQETYPDYCRTCQGWGTIKFASPHVQIEPCKECIPNGRCPPCGENALNKMDTCDKCGWYWDDGLPGSNVGGDPA
jgi:hypothetical protein